MAKVEELAKELRSVYRAVASGQASQLAETTGGLTFALLIGILVAYMVLASQFNSFLHPVTVLDDLAARRLRRGPRPLRLRQVARTSSA